jgi:hypothetical protein
MTEIRVNYTLSSTVPAGNYNNILDDDNVGVVIADCIDWDSGLPTGISVEFLNAYGVTVGSAATTDHQGWSQGYWALSYAVASGNQPQTTRLSGFEPSQSGTLKFSGFGNSADRPTQWTVNGQTTAPPYQGNTEPPQDFVTIPFTADGSGVVDILCERASGSSFAYQNGFGIDYTIDTSPKLQTPQSVSGDNPALAFTGSQLSTTALVVQAEWSLLPDFSVIGGVLSFPLNAPSDGSTFTADFKNGFEEALGTTASGFEYVPFTDGAVFCRWVFKDFEDNDIVLPFDSLDNPTWETGTPVKGYSHYEFDASEATTDADSLLADYVPYLPSGQPCQMAMPNSVTNELGGTVTFDFADPDHPLPNQYGGNTEALQATYIATAAVTTSNGEAWSQQVSATQFGYGGL